MDDNINWLDTIAFLEDYIIQHLKLNQKIKSLNMMRDIIHG